MAHELKAAHTMQGPSVRQPQAAVPLTYNRYLAQARRQEGSTGGRGLTDGSAVPLPSWSRASSIPTRSYQLSRRQTAAAIGSNDKPPLSRRRASLDLFAQPSSLHNTFNPAAPRRASLDPAAIPVRTFQLQQVAQPANQDQRTLKQSGPSRVSVFSRGAAERKPLETLESQDVEPDDAAFAVTAWNTEAPSLQVYAKQLQDPKVGIPTKEQKVKGVRTRIFNGSDAAEWFMLSMDEVQTSDDARVVGQKLLDMGLISSTEPDNTNFKVSNKEWYYFCHSSNYSRESVQLKASDNDGTTSGKTAARNEKTKPESSTTAKSCIIL